MHPLVRSAGKVAEHNSPEMDDAATVYSKLSSISWRQHGVTYFRKNGVTKHCNIDFQNTATWDYRIPQHGVTKYFNMELQSTTTWS
jgi:hypothetical protein